MIEFNLQHFILKYLGYRLRINSLDYDDMIELLYHHRQATLMSEIFRNFNFENSPNISLYMMTDDGTADAACRAMLNIPYDINSYHDLYFPNKTVKQYDEFNAPKSVRGQLMDENQTLYDANTQNYILNKS